MSADGIPVVLEEVTLGDKPGLSPAWLAPVLLWALSLVAFVCVLVPRRYAVGAMEPKAWKQGFARAARFKYAMLLAGVFSFAAGSIAAVLPILWG